MKEETARKIINKAIHLLETVPKEEFILGKFTNKVNKCCGIGHYQRLVSGNPSDYRFDNCSDFVNYNNESLRNACKFFSVDIARVNNTSHPSLIKYNVIQALRNIVASGWLKPRKNCYEHYFLDGNSLCGNHSIITTPTGRTFNKLPVDSNICKKCLVRWRKSYECML